MDLFSRTALETDGFRGFVRLRSLDTSTVPQEGGVYVVLREADRAPLFMEMNPGGRFKGKDPTVSRSVLDARWVADCSVIYVGKATSLRSRLRQYRDFGQGKPIGHWGGRYIWQLDDADQHLVCWRTTIESPRNVEQEMLADFRSRYGCLPFANISS